MPVSPSNPNTAPNTAWTDADLAQNPHAAADKAKRVEAMFSAIAPSYDLNNRVHSMWRDQAWRRAAVKMAELKAPDCVVDVACGTGDLAIEFGRTLWKLANATNRHRVAEPQKSETAMCFPEHLPAPVVGIDFTFAMLPFAIQKTSSFNYGGSDQDGLWDGRFNPNIWLNGDAMSLPLPDACCDVVSIAFGIRNVVDPAKAMREFFRVLRPGGRVIVLEFSLPTNAVMRGLYNFYFKQIMPRTATWIARDKSGAYKYLPRSVNTFIDRPAMVKMMADAGFTQTKQKALTMGIAVVYRGVKV